MARAPKPASQRIPKPTDAELTLLHVLWGRGPSTVREVLDALGDEKQVGYTTVLKTLQIMADKGLVLRDTTERSHVYRARLPQAATQRQLLEDLLERAFDGSASQLVMRALAGRRSSEAELAEIRDFLERLEGETP